MEVRLRWIAIALTALALLAISIPFVWERPVDAERVAAAGPPMVPATSHDATPPAERAGDAGASTPTRGETHVGDPEACMADAKPANLDFAFKDLDGKQVSLASFKGKVMLLNFWATWCGPCKAEIPGFVELQAKYRDKLVVVGYSVDDTADQAREFARQYKINYPILLGEGKEELQDAYGPVWGIPASFIISKDGRVCQKHLGIAPKAVFEKEVVALM